MTAIEYIKKLFTRAPYRHTTAYAALYRAVVAGLRDDGIRVGKGSFIPRVEVYGITESERLDKEGNLREFTMTVESISDQSQGDCFAMHDRGLERLTGAPLDLGKDWHCVGVVPEQLQDMTESGDTEKIIYRLLQTYRVFVERVKETT